MDKLKDYNHHAGKYCTSCSLQCTLLVIASRLTKCYYCKLSLFVKVNKTVKTFKIIKSGNTFYMNKELRKACSNKKLLTIFLFVVKKFNRHLGFCQHHHCRNHRRLLLGIVDTRKSNLKFGLKLLYLSGLNMMEGILTKNNRHKVSSKT